MNSLEFINKEIELTKDVIENTQEALSNDANSEIRMYCYFNKEAVLDKLNYAKERLQTLQQIKTDLEAWYEIKNLYLKGYFSRVSLPVESHKKFQKALEVKEGE